MTPEELPADPAQWPTDPYQLLGVQQGVALRDVKKAYTRLIRVFKPEQYPKQFRRIRDAYETVQNHLAWFGAALLEVPPPAEEQAAPNLDSTGEALPPPRPVVDQLDEAWELACSGEELAAFRRLQEMRAYPGHLDKACIRLYWLVTAFPDLMPQSSPSEFLLEALRANGLDGAAWVLYRREIAERPLEAISERCAGLYHYRAQPGRLADIAEIRWRSAASLNKWQVFESDISALRPLMVDAEDVWFQVLLSALDYLAWAPTNDDLRSVAAGRIWNAIQELTHLHTRFSNALDRLDVLTELRKDWQKLLREGWFPDLAALIPMSWCQPLEVWENALWRLLRSCAETPDSHLGRMDTLSEEQPSVLGQFGHMLNQLEYRTEYPADRRDPAMVSRLITDFLDVSTLDPYQRFRVGLLAFCLREAVAPEFVAQVAEENYARYWLTPDTHLEAAIRADLPLRFLCQACRLFWA